MSRVIRHFASRHEACLHFFRSLWNARELRHNPLVAHLFGEANGANEKDQTQKTVERIRAVVADAAQAFVAAAPPSQAAHRRRLQYLVTQCDLKGIAHKIVAHDLHLSMRQFYRERRAAVMEIGEHVERLLTPEPALKIELVLDAFTLTVHRANALAHIGLTDETIRMLNQCIAGVSDPSQRVRALCLLAQSLTNCNRNDEAREHLESASRLLPAIDPGDPERSREAAASVALGLAGLKNIEGDLTGSLRSMEEAFALLRADGSGTMALRELHADGLILQANLAMKFGDARQALRSLNDVRSVISLDEAPPALAVEYYAHLHEASAMAVSEAQALDAYERTARIAERNGFVTDAMIAEVYRAQYLMSHGDSEGAVRHAREALKTGSVMTAYQYSLLCLLVGEMEIAAGNGREAIACMRRGRRQLRSGGVDWARAIMLEGYGHLVARDYNSALRMSLRAVDEFRRLGNERYEGTALRILAEGYAGLGRIDEAKETVGSALTSLQKHGHPNSLWRAYAASAKITGNKRHGVAARELREALTS